LESPASPGPNTPGIALRRRRSSRRSRTSGIVVLNSCSLGMRIGGPRSDIYPLQRKICPTITRKIKLPSSWGRSPPDSVEQVLQLILDLLALAKEIFLLRLVETIEREGGRFDVKNQPGHRPLKRWSAELNWSFERSHDIRSFTHRICRTSWRSLALDESETLPEKFQAIRCSLLFR